MDVVDEANGIPTLEDRLDHFMEWLTDRGVNMHWADPNARIHGNERRKLVQEYVNE